MKILGPFLVVWTGLCAGGVAAEPAVYLDQDFGGEAEGIPPSHPALRRVDQVMVVEGGGRVGEGRVAHFHDGSDSGGAMEYNLGVSGLTGLYIAFDLLNNAPKAVDESSRIIFSVGQWNPSGSLMLNANAKRAMGLEFSQAGGYRGLVLRVGSSAVQREDYDAATAQRVQVWVNDHDQNTLSYDRPDNGEEEVLNPDSFVVWVSGRLVGGEPAFGYAMQKTVSAGTGVLGRVGFTSTSTGRADSLIDNLYVTDPTGESVPVAPGQELPSATDEVTPTRLPGAETLAYRTEENAMNLFVFKPEGWKATDRRPAFMYFFGGGWTHGTPLKSAGQAAWAAQHGMVGIAPDYRTKNRFGTRPLESVADGRAAFAWVVAHADELGIDPQRIAVGGSSAGGHVALWTALSLTPPGSDPLESPALKPAAVILSSAVTDTSVATGYTPERFAEHAKDLSPVCQLDSTMPPVLMFHAVDDELVDYSTAVALRDKLVASGNECRLVTVPRGGHGFSGRAPEWKPKVREMMEQFLQAHGLLPDAP